MNLNGVIFPRQHRDQLEAYLHQPECRHVWYITCFVTPKNFCALKKVEESMIFRRTPSFSPSAKVRVTYPHLVKPLPQKSNFLLFFPVSNATPKPSFLLSK